MVSRPTGIVIEPVSRVVPKLPTRSRVGHCAPLARFANHADAHPGMLDGNLQHAAVFILLFAVTLAASFGFLAMQRRCAEAELRAVRESMRAPTA